ncbi:MBG domain-containing protein, partial [Sphingobium sp. Sx8-8]|uniref:MBG domain-containing protein n=1 Tax=Sphingobium sp. Sx8-8 TaxID=2933617 RepID=UPI001F5AE364
IGWQAGTLTVTPAPLSLSYAANGASSVYGAGLAGLSGTVTGSGFVHGEGLGDLSGTVQWSTAASAGANAGSYAIIGSGLTSGNYAISATQAAANGSAYTITPAPLTIIADDVTKGYDGLAFSGGGGLHYAGFVNGDTQASLTGSLLWSGTAQGARDAGSYGIA